MILVPVGSMPELPADSCTAIKASEGRQAVSGNNWLDPTRSGNLMIARCNMITKGRTKAIFVRQHFN